MYISKIKKKGGEFKSFILSQPDRTSGRKGRMVMEKEECIVTSEECKDCGKNCYCWAGVLLLNSQVWPKPVAITFNEAACPEIMA